MSTEFPRDFLWGAATSAYQIEGSPLADGAGASNWRRFSHTPGRTLNGDTGDVACDHYRRWPEDIEWMKRLGLAAYRLSFNWARILPEGRGRVNPKGVDFYSRLIDGLLAAGIEPVVTLFHWDYPAALDDRGGWLNPDSAEWFADYAEVAFKAFGDRVKTWATLNEPWVVVDGGYLYGVNAPGHRNLFEAPIASHHLLRAHGAAVRRYRAGWKDRIGIVIDLEPKDPATPSPEDLAATRRADAYKNRQYLDPIFFGRAPDEMREIFGEAWIDYPPEDFALIRQPIDFLGVNYYTRGVVKHDPEHWPMRANRHIVPGVPHTQTNWEVFPSGLSRILCWVKERYGDLPLYITENGAAFPDPPHVSGDRLEDPARVTYYRDHLLAVHEAIGRGVDVRGYFASSLLDNFEWASGYAKRFGLLHVDATDQHRTIKASAEYYREVIRTRGGVLEQPLALSGS